MCYMTEGLSETGRMMGFSRERRDTEGEMGSQKKEEYEGEHPYFASPRHPGLRADSPAALPRVAVCHWSADIEDLERHMESMKRE